MLESRVISDEIKKKTHKTSKKKLRLGLVQAWLGSLMYAFHSPSEVGSSRLVKVLSQLRHVPQNETKNMLNSDSRWKSVSL